MLWKGRGNGKQRELVLAGEVGAIGGAQRHAGDDGVVGGEGLGARRGECRRVLRQRWRNGLDVEENLTVAFHLVRRRDEGEERHRVGLVVEDELLSHERVDHGVVLQGNEIRLVLLVLAHLDGVLLVEDVSVREEDQLLGIAVVEHVVNGLYVTQPLNGQHDGS